MNLGLDGKKAFVSGSTAGIGLACVVKLAREGAAVTLNGRTAARVEAAVAEVKKQVPQAKVDGIAADLGTAEGAKSVLERLPQVDVLVNNLGIFEAKPFGEIGDAEWLKFFEVNVLSGVRLARGWLPGMKKANWGRIMFISSESALQIPAEMVHYGTTKTAQLAVARGIAEGLTGTGITVNSILAGPTRSEGVGTFVEALARQQGKTSAQVEKEFFEQMRPTSLIKRFATPEEIAALVTFVASAEASAIHGAALRVDGGVVRAIA